MMSAGVTGLRGAQPEPVDHVAVRAVVTHKSDEGLLLLGVVTPGPDHHHP